MQIWGWDLPTLAAPGRFGRGIFLGLVIGAALSVSSTSLILLMSKTEKRKIKETFDETPIELTQNEVVDGVSGLVGMIPTLRSAASPSLGRGFFREHSFVKN
jgi:hypothetical protein